MNARATQPYVGTSPTVRPAEPSDVPAIVELINQAYRVESFFIDGERTDAGEIRALMRRGHFLVLDDRSGGLAGAIYVEPGAERGYFGLLSVHPDLQGSGLGRRLVAVAEALCEAQGCAVIDLQVVNLRTELPPWYRSLGYRECGTAPFESPKRRRPAHFIRMRKRL